MSETQNAKLYEVKYYNRQMSKRGKGVWVRTFTDLAEAEKFAAENQLYARPCVVKEVR